MSSRSGHLPEVKAGEAPVWRHGASAAEGPVIEPRLGVCQGKNRKRLEKAKERGSTEYGGVEMIEHVTSLGTCTGPVMPVR